MSYTFPAVIELSAAGSGEAAEVVRAVKEQRRRVPSGGASFAALRDLAPDESVRRRLRELGGPELALRVGEAPAAEPEAGCRPALELRLAVVGGEALIAWSFAPGAVARERVEALDRALREALREIVAAGRDGEAVAVSATDFPEAGLSQEDLDRVLGSL